MSTTNGKPIRTLKCGPDVMTTGEVGRRLGLAPRTVSRLIDSGSIKGYRIPGSNDRRVHREDFNAFCEQTGCTRAICEISPGPTTVLCLGCEVIEPGELEVIETRWTFRAGWEAAMHRPHIILCPIELGRLELQGIAEAVGEIAGYEPLLALVAKHEPEADSRTWYWLQSPVRGTDLLALLTAK